MIPEIVSDLLTWLFQIVQRPARLVVEMLDYGFSSAAHLVRTSPETDELRESFSK